MQKEKLVSGLVIAILLLPSLALAAGRVVVSITSAKEEIVVKSGKKYARVYPATKFTPGDTIIYTIDYTNAGDEIATNVVLDDPVPQGTVYIAKSATGADSDILYSIDGGKTYKQQSLLTYEVKLKDGTVEKRVASPEEYTNIRWIVKTVQAGAKGKVAFKVRVK